MEKQEFVEARRKAAKVLINESHAEVKTCAVLVTLTGDYISSGICGNGGDIASVLAQAMDDSDDLARIITLATKVYRHIQEQKDRLKNEE